MQRSWRTDKDKLTFIICLPDGDFNSRTEVVSKEDDAPRIMAGDVNLFLFEDDSIQTEEQSGVSSQPATSKRVVGEVEIMIAQSSSRGHGVGYRALSMFIKYVLEQQEAILREFSQEPCILDHLRAKIDAKNERSIALFKKAGFVMISEKPNYFGEVQMQWDMDPAEQPSTVRERLHKDRDSNSQRILRYLKRDERRSDAR
jgi:RimJ/RimL family protein N-acetyltransferase